MTRKTLLCLSMVLLLILLGRPVTLDAKPAAEPPLQSPTETPIPPIRPDEPTDAPSEAPAPQALAITAAAVGETIVTYQSSSVTFRVNDGYDLDQYLFRDSSPINFDIDLKGFNPVDPTQVTLRVWDVDQQGAAGYPQCQTEVDKVYVNDTYLGDLTGANAQWSIVTFSIPPNTLNPNINHFRVDIDTLGTDCWAVEVDWAEVRIPIPFRAAQVEASVDDDIDIKRGTSDEVIGDLIWQTDFNADGSLIWPPNLNDPIADKINGSLTYNCKIGYWPSNAAPTWQPTVKYEWKILLTPLEGKGEQSGWENDFNVKMPDQVGRYTLWITLETYHENELLHRDYRSHTLYVLLNEPETMVVGGVEVNPPRAAWLDVATTWANGSRTDVGILQALNSREYGGGRNPLGWRYADSGQVAQRERLERMIEAGQDENGMCGDFVNVWRILAGSLGIETRRTDYFFSEYGPINSVTLITPDRPSLAGYTSASACDLDTGMRDRWNFDNHTYGEFDGTYYDPTFGVIAEDKDESFFCKGNETLNVGEVLPCIVLNPPPPQIFMGGTAATNNNGWNITVYQDTSIPLPVPAPPSSCFQNVTMRSGAATPVSLEAAASSGAATFTGNAGDAGYDADSNGLFELLQVEVELNVTQAGDFALMADLVTPDGETITTGSLSPGVSLEIPLVGLALETGTHQIPIYFEGRRIRNFGVDGPYIVKVKIAEQGVVLDEVDLTTQAYSHQDFQGPLVEVVSISDTGVDNDTLPGNDLLRVAAQVNALGAGNVMVLGQVFAGGTHLDSYVETVSLVPGMHTMNLDFDATKISASGLDGPYQVYLSFEDIYFTSNKDYTTTAYPYTDFQSPNAFFTGVVSDSGQDTNGNGQYDALNVVAEAYGLVPGTYTVRGFLRDSTGNPIAVTQTEAALGNTSTPVTLSFDGVTIYRHEVNGPYQIALILTDSSDNSLVHLERSSTAYAYTDFEHPTASLNGQYADSGVDTDGNGLYNFLRVNVGVEVNQAGMYRVEGALQDNQDDFGFITGGQTEVYLAAGSQTVALDFDGSTIYAHGVDGPYPLLTVRLVQPGTGTIDSQLTEYETAAYAYTSFESSDQLQIEGFSDRGEDTNGNGLYEWLAVDMQLLVNQSDTYAFNARLVDAQGEEIVWASGAQYLTPGAHQIALRFDGRYIYGNGVDGPYQVRDLSVYSASQFATLLEAHTTAAYPWTAFEPSGVVSGAVIANEQPLPNANIFISGVDSDLTNSNGAYRLAVLNGGSYTINIDADPSLSPWHIWVNGQEVAVGTSATIPVSVGSVTEVNFVNMATTPTPTPTPTDTPTPTSCALYPIALHSDTVITATVGQPLPDVYNGAESGNFGWLRWTEDNSVSALVQSLTPPGNSDTYVNPDDAGDHALSAGDWVYGRPGIANAQDVREALDMLQALDTLQAVTITVPVWDMADEGQGNNLKYHVAGFANIQITDYDLPGQSRISATYQGAVTCP